MPKTLLMDEIHISIHAPSGLPDRDHRAIQRTLSLAGLQRQLRAAVVAFFQRYRTLEKIRIVISR